MNSQKKKKRKKMQSNKIIILTKKIQELEKELKYCKNKNIELEKENKILDEEAQENFYKRQAQRHVGAQ